MQFAQVHTGIQLRFDLFSFQSQVAFDMYIGDRDVTNGILEYGHSWVAAFWVEEQTKGYVDLHQFSPSDKHLRNRKETNTNVKVTLSFTDHFWENSSTYTSLSPPVNE